MTLQTAAGAGITLAEPPSLTIVPDLAEDAADQVSDTVEVTAVFNADGTEVLPPVVDPDDPISMLREEMRQAVADIEWRLAQVYEQKLRAAVPGHMDMVVVEDMNDGVHRLTGYTLTQNTPAGGGTWASLHLVFKGIDYNIANGSTTNKYVWFIKANATNVTATTADMTLMSGNTFPTLGPEDALLFVNNAGVIRSVLEESVPSAVMPGSIEQGSLAADVSLVLTNLRSDLTNAQATADGAIVSYFQNTPPWPAGSNAPGPNNGSGSTGDVWYDADDGGAFRWSGPTGTPVNTWVRIADTDTAALASKVGTRTTTYVLPSTTPPAAPAAQGGVPAGFSTGDLWMVTDMNNLMRRWSGTAWVDLQLGDAAISGIGGAKVGTGINGSNVTTGTVVAARVGAGVNGAVLTTATGTVGNTQIATGAVGSGQLANGAATPAKINAAFHLLY